MKKYLVSYFYDTTQTNQKINGFGNSFVVLNIISLDK